MDVDFRQAVFDQMVELQLEMTWRFGMELPAADDDQAWEELFNRAWAYTEQIFGEGQWEN